MSFIDRIRSPFVCEKECMFVLLVFIFRGSKRETWFFVVTVSMSTRVVVLLVLTWLLPIFLIRYVLASYASCLYLSVAACGRSLWSSMGIRPALCAVVSRYIYSCLFLDMINHGHKVVKR